MTQEEKLKLEIDEILKKKRKPKNWSKNFGKVFLEQKKNSDKNFSLRNTMFYDFKGSKGFTDLIPEDINQGGRTFFPDYGQFESCVWSASHMGLAKNDRYFIKDKLITESDNI